MDKFSDIGPYTLVPRWIFDLGMSPEALRLYLLLGFHANWTTHVAWPSREELATELQSSVRSVQRWIGELESFQAIQVTRPKSGNRYESNRYVVAYSIPDYLQPEETDESPLEVPRQDSLVQPGETALSHKQEKKHPDLSPNGDSNTREKYTSGRIVRLPEQDEAQIVALAVWEERKQGGTLPLSASKGNLINIARKLVAKVGSERAHAVLVDVPMFSLGAVDYALAKNGKSVDDLIAASKTLPPTMAEKAKLRHKETRGTH